MQIARATPQDFPGIADLNVEAYREFAAHLTPEAWRTMQTNLRMVESTASRATFLIIRHAAEIIGSVAYCPAGKSDPTIFPTDWASILLLAVSPRHRSAGIGRALVDACLRLARDDQVAIVGLFTSELMATARGLYARMGFRQDGEIPRRHGLRYWRYRLDLSS